MVMGKLGMFMKSDSRCSFMLLSRFSMKRIMVEKLEVSQNKASYDHFIHSYLNALVGDGTSAPCTV